MTIAETCALLRAADRAFDAEDYQQARAILSGLLVALGAKRRRKPGAKQAAVQRLLVGYAKRQAERVRRRRAIPKHSPLKRLPKHWGQG